MSKKTQFDKLREKIHEAKDQIEPQNSQVSNAFYCALKSVLETMDEIESEEEFILGNYYYAWNLDEVGFVYAKLVKIDKEDENLPYRMKISPSSNLAYWYEYISKYLPKDLINPLND